tara:strand:- start:617 stop:985 length:369 start_codon:yes stop_codon:yes gene_type:complete
VDEDKVNEVVEEEKRHLKEDRVYIVLQLDKEDKEQFSMLCLDTTKDDVDKKPNVVQIIARGITDLLSHDLDGLLDLGLQGIERDKQKNSNIVWLDSYRPPEEDDPTVITFAFEDKDEEEKDE